MAESDYKERRRLRANPDVVFRAMGNDLVAVNEKEDRVAVLNATARVVLEGAIGGESDGEIATRLEKEFQIEEKVDMAGQIGRVRAELLEARLILKQIPFEVPLVKVRDLAGALGDLDFAGSQISQVE